MIVFSIIGHCTSFLLDYFQVIDIAHAIIFITFSYYVYILCYVPIIHKKHTWLVLLILWLFVLIKDWDKNLQHKIGFTGYKCLNWYAILINVDYGL